jgi:hypothetical protein
MKTPFNQYRFIAALIGRDGIKYMVSMDGNESDLELIKKAEAFYGKKMQVVIERY